MDGKTNECVPCRIRCDVFDFDPHGYSYRTNCPNCGLCYLLVKDHVIGLRVFHIKRGSVDWQRPISDTTMAEAFIADLRLDVKPSPAKCLDFGINSDVHYRALRDAVQSGLTPWELDSVMGDGLAISRLVEAHTAKFVKFQTSYDRSDWPYGLFDDELEDEYSY